MNKGLRLFRLFGIDVYADWTWGLVAVYLYWRTQDRQGLFTGHPHGVGYQTGFLLCYILIVLLHEFGHALACQWVGGQVARISLTFFGGAAAIRPPQRASAMLWSIVAGPLVNMVLLPATVGPALYLYQTGHAGNTAADFIGDVAYLNAFLLVFNMLPFYPLDGGQILRSLLWFVCGRGLSLILAAMVGIIGCAALLAGALWMGWIYAAFVVGIMLLQCARSVNAGRVLYKLDRQPRRQDAACPQCGQNPPVGPMWSCACGMRFDTFQTGAQCPACAKSFESTMCPYCLQTAPVAKWHGTGGFPVEVAAAAALPQAADWDAGVES